MPDAIVERDGHLLTVTMNRPERMNALSGAMLVRMYDAFVEASTDDEIRCIILTGAGGNFCSGADLRAMAGDAGASDPEIDVAARMAADPELHWKALLRTYRPTKPIVAAVEGVAIAGGTEILLTGKHLSAREASAIGLVGHVVPDGQALAKAREIAQLVCENGPLAVDAVLRTLHETDGMDEEEALAHEFEYGWKVFQSEDAREGPRAFKEKRKPVFRRR